MMECKQNAIDAIVPIPMHWTKRFQRGFQASAVIADGVQVEMRLPILLRCLRVVRRTAKQGTLETPERFRNVEGAFVVTNAKQIVNKRLLVIDDVMTSGATISQAAKMLLAAKASEIIVGVVARGARVS
jgi:predicted amidophosphoribosyltransferase